MKVSGVITDRVRFQLGDTITPYRWDNPELLAWLNDGRRHLYGLKPDAFYTSTAGIVLALPEDLTISPDVDVDVTDYYIPALVDYVKARALSDDNENAANLAVANDALNKYVGGIQ